VDQGRDQAVAATNAPARGPWAACFARDEAAALAPLRLRTDVRACVTEGDGRIWLRGEATDDTLQDALRRLAPLGRFDVTEDGALVPRGNLLPTAQLPDATWMPLSDLLGVRREPASLVAQVHDRVELTLVRTDRERPATMLLTDLTAWSSYAHAAPSTRLHPLRFAASQTHALIWGSPLPPLPGTRLYEQSGVSVPCGFTWSPAIDVASLRRALELEEDDVAVFAEDGSWQLLPTAAFVQARRSAVRLTMKEMQR